MPLRLDNAKALPTCPQQTQQKHNKLKPRFQLTVRLAQCQRTSAARTPRPRARSNRRGGRHRLGIPGRLHIGTPGRLRRNPHFVKRPAFSSVHRVLLMRSSVVRVSDAFRGGTSASGHLTALDASSGFVVSCWAKCTVALLR
jgi:hypothetical protein